MNYRNYLVHHQEGLPHGLYWGIRFRDEDDNTWKLDLWATDSSTLDQKRREREYLRANLDDRQRKVIIRLKHALLTPEGRTPVGSGHRIYEAVLFRGLLTEEAVRDYLRRHGVRNV